MLLEEVEVGRTQVQLVMFLVPHTRGLPFSGGRVPALTAPGTQAALQGSLRMDGNNLATYMTAHPCSPQGPGSWKGTGKRGYAFISKSLEEDRGEEDILKPF